MSDQIVLTTLTLGVVLYLILRRLADVHNGTP